MYYLVPLAYDHMENGGGNGSRERCNAVLRIIQSCLPAKCWVGSFAGYSLYNLAGPKGSKPLCQQMINYIEFYSGGVGVFFADPQAWGTYEEIRYALQRIDADQKFRGESENKIIFSTNYGHGFRIRMILFFLTRELKMDDGRFTFSIIHAHHSFTPKEWVQETIKFGVYLYKFVFKKW